MEPPHWKNSRINAPDCFPIAVWVQGVRNAAKYKAAGIDFYVGLSDEASDAQLVELARIGMYVVCEQNEHYLKYINDPVIAGWMRGDEPDNAQSLPGGKGYGPPIAPARIIEEYKKMRDRDRTRPVLLNLGQGVAWKEYIGRGVRTGHQEDYAEYMKGGDVVSFDVYPAVHDAPAIAGKLEFVRTGVENLRKWSSPDKIIWDCIEASRIGNVKTKPTAAQIKSEIWMSIIAGSRGIIYFVHQFKPTFVEASLLQDPELLEGVSAINRQIHQLASVINSPKPTTATLKASAPGGSVLIKDGAVVREDKDSFYIFAASPLAQDAIHTFELRAPANRKVEASAGPPVEVIGESRTLSMRNGGFRDAFAPYAVHLYRIPKQ